MKACEQNLHDENRAVYLPAISDSYARPAIRNKTFAGTSLSTLDLDFLRPDNELFHYPFALYSAGQAAPKRGSTPTADMVQNRDRQSTIVLGDSGGFQIQTGSNKITFDAGTPQRMMRWMEAVTDWSMILDFPTGGISKGTIAPHAARLRAEGHDLDALNASNRLGVDYNACLLQTKLNNDEFVANRTPGATRFLNVLQGRSESESRYWYEAVRHYPFEGWAFAGAHQTSLTLILSRLLDMHRDGLLGRCGWLHVLGVSTLPMGVLLTQVQRSVRALGYPDFQISFDTSSPFKMAAKYQIVAGCSMDREGWTTHNFRLSEIPDELDDLLVQDALTAMLEKNPRSRVALTGVGKRARVFDLRGHNMLLMNHNVEAWIDAHEQATNMMFDDALIRDPLGVTVRIKTIAVMIEQIISGKAKDSAGRVISIDQRKAIKDWAHDLDALRR